MTFKEAPQRSIFRRRNSLCVPFRGRQNLDSTPSLSLNAVNLIVPFIQSDKTARAELRCVVLPFNCSPNTDRLTHCSFRSHAVCVVQEKEVWDATSRCWILYSHKTSEVQNWTMRVKFNPGCVQFKNLFCGGGGHFCVSAAARNKNPLRLWHSLLITALLLLMVTSAWPRAERQKLSICLLQTWLLPRYVLPYPHPA